MTQHHSPTLAQGQEEADLLALLDRLAKDSDRSQGPEARKAAVRSARQTGPEPWPWLAEAARRIGLRSRPLECSWERAVDLLETGPLVARGPRGWLLVLQSLSGGRVRAYRPLGAEELSLSVADLLEELGSPGPEEPIRWGVVYPLGSAPLDAGSVPSPGRRLLSLVAPDRQDIKTLVAFAVVVGLLNLATPVAVEALVNTVAFVGLLQPIVVLALVLAGCLGFAAVVRVLEAVVVELLLGGVWGGGGAALAYGRPGVERAALPRVHGPELVNRFFDITTVQKVGSKLLLDGVTAVLSAAIGLLVLAFYHPLLLAFDVVLLCALAVIVFAMGRGAVRSAVKESSAKYAVADWLEELVRHPLAFHLAGGRELALDHADTLATGYLEARAAHYRIVLRQLIGALALQVLASTLLLGLGGWLVKIGQLTLGQLVASWLIVSLVLAAVAKLGRQLEGVYDLLAAADKLGVLLDLPLERDAGEEPPRPADPAAVRLLDVTHRWPDGSAAVSGVSLAVDPGERLAICGPSGVGKTTLLELIQGQRACAAGRIELDGVDLRSLRPTAVRPQVALVRPGEVVSATVTENIRLGRPLELSEVQAALEGVGLWEAVQQLPQGLETPLTSFGRPLSEGQADLLALGRAVASRPRLLLVDGLLDGLAEETLDRVFLHLTRGPWTLVVATRRLEVARRCERRLRLTSAGLEELR